MQAEIYGHRHLGVVFRPFVEIEENGFLFKGRRYLWSAVRSVRVYDGLNTLTYPRAVIRLTDGTNIWLSARAVEKDGVEPHVGFLTSKSDAFNELVGIFQRHVA